MSSYLRTLSGLAIVLTVMWSAFGVAVVRGQGGTGRPTAAPTPKKTTGKKTPAKKSGSASPGTSAGRQTGPHTEIMPPSGGAWIRLVWIPPGTFTMGSDNGRPEEKPAHQVTIGQGFYMGKYEVTQAQWQSVMGNNPSYFKTCGGNCPVDSVTWVAAQTFIQKLNQSNDGYTYRLPTEAEWEYACRAGVTGDYAGEVKSMAWYSENSQKKIHPVGQKQPNAWGLFDMNGNIFEWCEDWHHSSYEGAPTDGSAWLSDDRRQYRVIRGGSWFYDATYLRSAFRSYFDPADRFGINGFRLVAVARAQ